MCNPKNFQRTATIIGSFKKVVLPFFIFNCIFSNVFSQHVSLSDGEIKKLILLVKNDKKVNKQFQNIQHLADTSLYSTPQPIQTISTAGRLQGDPIKSETKDAIKDFKIMYALAISYRITGIAKYLTKATDYLVSWATNNQPSGSPIDDTNLDALVEAYDLVKNYLQVNDKITIANWLEKTAIAETKNLKMLPVFETGKNNWNSHRLKIVGEIAFAINNKNLQQWTIEKLKDHLAINLLPDGSSIDFALRDAVQYHVYDLEPLVRLSIILQRATKVDYFHFLSTNNSSIKKSVDWLIPFVTKEKSHEEFVNTTVKFDKSRSNNKEEGHTIGHLFVPTKAIKLLTLCTYFTYPFDVNTLLAESKPNTLQYWQLTLIALIK